jgi:hypothetical protein
MKLKKLAASVLMLAGGTTLPCAFAQQAVLVSDGTAPPAGSQASGVTVNGSTVSTGGITNTGAFDSKDSVSGVNGPTQSELYQSQSSIGASLYTPTSFSTSTLTATSASTTIEGFHYASSVALSDSSFSIGTEHSDPLATFTGITYAVNENPLSVPAGTPTGIKIGVSGTHQQFEGLYVNNGTATATNDVVAGRNVVAGGQVVAGDGVVANGRVENVADGVAPTDAVNVQQLNQALGNSGVFAGQIHDLGRQIGNNRTIASTGTAIAMAAASVPALESDRRFGLGVGTGTYDGHSAVSIAGAARVSQNVQVKLNLGTGSGGKTAAGAGALFSW